jgi:hypothetical protein
MRGSGTLLTLALILLIGAGSYEYRAHHANAATPTESNAQEAATTEASATLLIDQLELQVAQQPKTLKRVRCVRASARPSAFGHNPGDAFDCRAIFTTAIQRWCVLFNPNFDQIVTYFQGQRMCEGAPNPTIEP